MTRTIPAPSNGLYRDMEDDDNPRGPERDETDTFHQLVRHLVADGDSQAVKAGRRARRKVAEMAPGFVRQPVLRMTTADIVFKASEQARGYAA
ncbi:hypothetical protein ACFV8T_39375 [Streptomyces sp. NPDC059832]|uniref:hypothetical protein n=1 Tax=Streptomyces sp. NPDC059832 TaxID=3346966 RepID=UPI00366702EB